MKYQNLCIFINENSNVLVLCHKGYDYEYNEVKQKFPGGIFKSGWFPNICNKKLVLYDLLSILTDDIKELLDEKIQDLLQ